MNVLLVTDCLSYGGVEKHVIDLAGELAARGHTVHVASSTGALRSALPGSARFLELHLVDPHSGRKNFSGSAAAIFTLARYIAKHNVSVIHSHKRHADFIAAASAAVSGIRHISTVHLAFTDKTYLPASGDRIIACSHAVKKNLVDRFGVNERRVTVIHNAIRTIDPSSFDAGDVCGQFGLPREKMLALTAANFNSAKDHLTLVRAIALHRTLYPATPVHFVLAGSGELKSHVRAEAERANVLSDISFIPWTPNIYALMSACSFFVLASRNEGYPYVIIESAMFGKPSIASDVGGVAEFITHGINGQLVRPGDVDRLARSIEYYCANPAIVASHGAAARQTMLEIGSIDAYVDKLTEIYMTTVAP